MDARACAYGLQLRFTLSLWLVFVFVPVPRIPVCGSLCDDGIMGGWEDAMMGLCDDGMMV